MAMSSGNVKGRTHTLTGTEPSGTPPAVTQIVPEYSPAAVLRGMYTSTHTPWFVPGSTRTGSEDTWPPWASASPPAIGISASGYQPVGAFEAMLGSKTWMECSRNSATLSASIRPTDPVRRRLPRVRRSVPAPAGRSPAAARTRCARGDLRCSVPTGLRVTQDMLPWRGHPDHWSLAPCRADCCQANKQ